ncbi:hypothetical protein A1O3_04237 [Capronia epimyces CBS 606.96]|uniref:Uncharacterized protein n=1 Tax=Capronia epimyces CBS 606.96 TaxID=1182542 RepID=W9Y440_9EURO|nr:uncharacterized protein A1O3_04237 [Capronia epimyces CBS 606.96]EXJ87278.1 hypothetical protein A1O3_04237 [Capronia epimyces CBS 606.96]
MDSASSSGTEDHTSTHEQDHDRDQDSSPLLEARGGLADFGPSSANQGPRPQLATEGLHDDDIIGVSIGRSQTHMRSPETPAAEKARALNLPLESFQRILSSTEEENESEDQQEPDSTSAYDGLKPTPLFLDGKASTSTIDLAEDKVSSAQLVGSHHKRSGHGQAEGSNISPKGTYADHIRKGADLGQESSTPRTDQSPLLHPRAQTDIEAVPQEESRNGPFHKSSLAKAFLNAADHSGRGRSFSGPTALFSNLRKYLPDIPSPSFNRSSISLIPFGNKNPSNSDFEPAADSPLSPFERAMTFRWSVREPVEKQEMTRSQPVTPPERLTSGHLASAPKPMHRPDAHDEALLSPISPASTKSRARSNSEGSLYLMRKASGMSTWDDINAFADITEMANSRLKAITDSFQNSSLRLPKLPTIRPIPKRIDTVATGRDGHAHAGQGISKKVGMGAGNIQVETPQQRAHPILARALSKTTGDIVVLGGYRGSILRSAQPPHRQLWVPLKVGFNLRKVDLEVGLTREEEARTEETVIPSNILSHIGPIDICRRLLRHMRKCPNARDNKLRVHDWGYDWRLSPDLLSGRLIKFLESLECNQPGTPPERRGATVVAHSLGGLITRHAVNQRPDLFAGVVYAGVPQHCVNILGPLRNGDDVLLSSKVLTAQVNFTFRTSFALLPDDGHCFLQKHTNKRYDLDFFDPHVWDEYRLSPCVSPPLHHQHRRNSERRKSLMGTISDTISSSGKRGSAQQTLEAANQRLGDTATEAARMAEDPGEEVMGPTMKQAQHAQNRPSVATACTIPKDAAMEYLGRTLSEIRAFRQQLNFNPSHQENNLYPPHGLIFGKTVPTVYGARVANKEAIKYDDAYDDLAFAAGDGVVLASAAQLPEGYRCVKGGRVESDRGHVGILGDLEGVGRCLEAVVEARAKGVGRGKDALRNRSDQTGL